MSDTNETTETNKMDFTEIHEEKEKEQVIRTIPKSPTLRVAADTPIYGLGRAIVGCVKDWGKAELLCVGAAARLTADKAIIKANEIMAPIGIVVGAFPAYMEPRPVINGVVHTGIRVVVRPFDLSQPQR